MTQVAELLIEIGADTADAERGLDSVNEKVGKSDGLFSKAAGGVLGFSKNLLKFGGIAAGIIGLPSIGGGIMSSWNQVSGVEQATVAMNAYAESSEDVDAVLSQLLGYARSDMGVLFNRTELFSAAQSMLMYGASIEDVADYTETLSRSVGLGLSDWDQLNRVIGRVGSTGRLTGDDFDYLKAAGFQLDDSLRNTNMTWEELFTHLDAGIPADALAGQADTIRGKMIRMQSAFRNVGNAILGVDSETSKFIEGGLGDMLVKGIDKVRAALNASVPLFALFAGAVASGFTRIGEVVGPVFDFVINTLTKFGDYISVFGVWRGLMHALANTFDETFGAGAGNKVVKFFMDMETHASTAKNILSQVWNIVQQGASVLLNFGTSVAGIVGDFIGFVQGSDNAKLAIESLAVGLGVALVAFKAFQAVQGLVAVFNAVRTAVLGFNAALLANPVVLVVAGIAALAAAVYFAYKRFEPFRKIVNQVGSVLKDFGKAVGREVVRGFDALMTAIRPVASLLGGTLLSGAKSLWSTLQTLGSVVGGNVVSGFNMLRSAATAVWDALSTILSGGVAAAFSVIRDTVEEIIDPFISLKDAIQAAFSGDWSTAFDKLKEAAVEAVEAMVAVVTAYPKTIIAFFKGVDWGALWEGLKSAATTAFDGVTRAASNVINGIRNAISNLDFGALIQGGWNLINNGIRLAWDAITSLDWGNYITELAWSVFVTAVDLAKKVGSFAWKTFVTAVDLAAKVGAFAWKSYVAYLDWIADGIVTVLDWAGFFTAIDWLKDGLVTVLDWLDILTNPFENFSLPEFKWPSPQDILNWLFGPSDWEANPDGSITEPDTGTTARPVPEANPNPSPDATPTSTPTTSNFGNFNAVKGGDVSVHLRNIATNAQVAGAALRTFDAQQIRTGNQSVISFGLIDQSARPTLVGVDSHTQRTASSIRGTWTTSLGTMAAQSLSQFGIIRSHAVTQTNQAQSAVTSNSATMNSNLSRQLGAMASSSRTEMASLYGSVNSQMSASNVATTAQTTAMALVTRVQLALAAANAKSQMSTMASNVESGATAASGHLSGQTARWAAIILSAGSGAASTARSVGSNIGNSLASGMMSALGAVTASANALIAQVDRAMRARARIASPSKMTTYFGEMIGEGLVEGMDHMMGDVSRAGTKLSNAALYNPVGSGTPSVGHQNGVPNGGGNITVNKLEVTIPVKDVEDIKSTVDFVKRLDIEYELKTA